MEKTLLEHLKLRAGQQKAFFSYRQIFIESIFHLDRLTKTISAMANAIGGEIYIGFQIQKFKFKGFDTKPNHFPSETIFLNLIQEYLQPKIELLTIETIEDGLVIKVPNSNIKPHISPNYRYYKRVLSKNQVMEEFEIRHLYQSSSKSLLKIINLTKLQGIPLMNAGKFEEMRFYPRIHIQNLGQRIEKDYKLEISIPSALVDENFTILHKYLKGYELDKNIYTIPSSEPLFQEETKMILELVLKVNNASYKQFSESSLDIKLYSTEGIHELSYKISEWFHYKGNLPLQESFVKKIEE